MSKTYSLDLRLKVLEYIERGGKKREASGVFNIGEDTIYRWIRLKKLGNLSAKKRVSSPKKVDVEGLKEYVLLYPDHTLKEIGSAFNVAGKTIFVWLRKLNITRKKRRHYTKNAMKPSVENLGKYLPK